MAEKAKLKIRKAAAAAIVSVGNLPETFAAEVDTSKKFVVHPHVASVGSTDTLLLAYLGKIYEGRRPLSTIYPGAAAFAQLKEESTVAKATKALAMSLAESMSKKHANAGILFGFAVELDDAIEVHGIIKADLDDEQRFFLAATDRSWSIGAVRDILPAPRSEYAKFAIAPQPNGTAAAGIRDITDNAAAADYFLDAIGLVVPRTSGTQAAVAQVALAVGYSHRQIQERMQTLTTDSPVEDFVREAFPQIPDKRAAGLQGTATRPMPSVHPGDPYKRVYKTRNPYFELTVDETVQVEIDGRVVKVTLPEGSDTIDERAR